jgi:hypothetical protein
VYQPITVEIDRAYGAASVSSASSSLSSLRCGAENSCWLAT